MPVYVLLAALSDWIALLKQYSPVSRACSSIAGKDIYQELISIVVNSHGGEVVRRPNIVFIITIDKETKL